MSRQDVYLGANEARELVGRWHGVHPLMGSDFSIYNRGQAAGRGERHRDRRREREWDRPWDRGNYGSPWQPQTPFQFAGGRGQAPYAVRTPAPNVRDHRVGEVLQAAGNLMAAGFGNIPPRAYLRDMPEPDMANRQVLPMNTGTTPVPVASTAQITSRPQRVAFRPERVFVSSADIGGSGSAANWIINDITIGNRSQFAQSGALPGDMFSNVAIDSFVTFETAQTAMDVVMIVTYQGATEGGTPFYGSIIGTAAV